MSLQMAILDMPLNQFFLQSVLLDPSRNCQIPRTVVRFRSRVVLRRSNTTEEYSAHSAPASVLPDSKGHSKKISNGEDDRDLQKRIVPKNWDWVPVLPHVLTAAMANFLFGYHIGVVNGPLPSIAQDLGFVGDAIMEGFVVSIFLIGAFIGSLSGGILADKVGRRRTFQLDMIPMILGAALSASSQDVHGMLLGRFLVGLGIGVNTALVPLYISEIAPTKYRGALGSFCQVGTCVGIIAALLIGIPAEVDPHWWRTMFWVATIPAMYLVVAMQFTAESPRWLAKVGYWEEAQNVINSLWGSSEVEKALEELRNAEKCQEEASWAEVLFGPNFKVAAIGGILFMLQQFAGINGVLYFSTLTFHDAGITDSTAASSAVGVANLIGALVALSLMDTQGRRKLLMGSYSGMAISMLMLVLALEIHCPDQFSHFLSITGMLMYVFTFALGAGPVTALITAELCSTRLRAKTMAVALCVHWVCNFGIGLFFLELVEHFGLPAVYASFGVVCLLAVAFANSFIFETKGRSLEEINRLLIPQTASKEE